MPAIFALCPPRLAARREPAVLVVHTAASRRAARLSVCLTMYTVAAAPPTSARHDKSHGVGTDMDIHSDLVILPRHFVEHECRKTNGARRDLACRPHAPREDDLHAERKVYTPK